MKVLVAEDNNTVRACAVEYLTRTGHTVLEATRGFDAVRMVSEHRPDVVVLDGLMPDMHGFEVTRLIRSVDSEYSPRIVLMSAIYRSRQYQNDAKLRYGVDRYVSKPLTEGKMLEAVTGTCEWLAFNVDDAPHQPGGASVSR